MMPIIFEYMDIRHFLQDFFKYRKTLNPKFSYGMWSQQLGFSNKTLLRLIVLGKRKITPKTRQRLKDFFNFDAHSEVYFEVLVDYSQTSSSTQKNALGQQLIQLQRKRFVQPETLLEQSVLKDPYSPMILTLINSSESALSSEEIAKIIKLPLERLGQILEVLEAEGQIKRREDLYEPVNSTFKIPDLFGSQGLRKFYSYWLQKSVSAIDLPYEVRRFRSLQIVLNQEEFEELNKSFQNFVVENLSRFEHNCIDDRKLYILNTSIFPITDSIRR